jgi:hypothetical protein
MSSSRRILKTCAFCKLEFIAKKTTTKACSDFVLSLCISWNTVKGGLLNNIHYA